MTTLNEESNPLNWKYNVQGYSGYSFSEALRLYKTRYNDFDTFCRMVITHDGMTQFAALAKQFWEDTPIVTVQEALQYKNLEHRRVSFLCIGIENLFKALQPELIKSETVHKINHRWDSENILYSQHLNDTYELYRIPKEKFFRPEQLDTRSADVFAVRCQCTSTQRDYFIYVNDEAVKQNDPIEAISWTIRLNVKNPKRIYRQGDIIIAEADIDAQVCEPYHLSREQYLNLMYAET